MLFKGGVGKREAQIYWSMAIPENASPATRTTLKTTRGLLAVNAIGTQLRDLINSGLSRWGLIHGDAVEESRRDLVSKHQIQPE